MYPVAYTLFGAGPGIGSKPGENTGQQLRNPKATGLQSTYSAIPLPGADPQRRPSLIELEIGSITL